jgi:hypothetical protein
MPQSKEGQRQVVVKLARIAAFSAFLVDFQHSESALKSILARDICR